MTTRQLIKRLAAARAYSTTKSSNTNKAVFLSEKQLQLFTEGGAERFDLYSSNSDLFSSVPTIDQLRRSFYSELLVEEIDIVSEHHVRGSEEAAFGSKRIGCVELPKPLVKGIADLIEGNTQVLACTKT